MTTHAASPGEVFGQRYAATTLLKDGLGVQTFLGRDLRDGSAVVIKRACATEVSPGAQLRLEHEAEVLRDFAGAGIAPLLDVGRQGNLFYLVMPFIAGVTLAERIAAGGPLSTTDAIAVGRGLLRALQAAHAHGVLHREVKPSNVVVGEGSPPPVTLIDFGLARSVRTGESLRDVPVRTIAYVSPEQAGLIRSEMGERSDLYSAGIVLYECLAGRPPFVGHTVGEVLRQHLTTKPPELCEVGRPVPRALDGVIRRLLEKDPRSRYQTAAAALADLDEIAAALDQGVREPTVVVGAHDRRRALSEPAFVGRDEELRTLEEQLSCAARGDPVLVLVEGESGAGKTCLLDRAAVMGRQHGAWVLRGSPAERVVRRPMQIVEGMVHEIVLAARDDPALAETLRDRLCHQAETLCAAAPSLREVLPAGATAAPGPEAHVEARIVAALVELIDAVGASSRPVVIELDDCQWMGELAGKLLGEWRRAHSSGRRPTRVLLIAAYRTEDVSTDSPLRTLAPDARISLGPLAPEDVRRMAESMAGALPPAAVALVQRLSEGNPFLAAAVVEGLVEGGALVDGPRGWELDSEGMAEAQSSRRAAWFLARRLENTSAGTLHLLSIGAVLGKSFELKLASELAGRSTAEAMAAVVEARRRRFVWLESGGSRCTFVHDRLRDAVLERLDPEARRRLHLLAAERLERDDRSGTGRAFDLAHHYDAAGDPLGALPHALSAAAEARARCALELAESNYRIAARGAEGPGVDPEIRRRVAEGLGDVLLLRGRYDEAASTLARARALAAGATAQAAIDGKLGELAFKRGDVSAAADALDRALRILGHRVPRGPVRMAFATLWLVLVQVAHTLLPGRLVARRRLEEGEADLLAAHIFSRLAYANWFIRGQVATFWAHLSELNIAERYPPSRELAQACSEHSISVTGLPRFFFRRGVRYAERGLAIREALGDAWGVGQSLNFYGMLLYAFGRYEDALEKFRQARRVLRRTGDRWEANLAGAHIAFCDYRLGALREAVAECRDVHREGLEIGDRHASAIVLEIWAKATGGAVPAELVQTALDVSADDPQTRETLLQAAAVRAIGAGRPKEAVSAFAAAAEVARAAHLKSEYVSYTPIWIAHARRLDAIQTAIETGVLPLERLRATDEALRRGVRLARRHRGNLPMALRERALLAALRRRSPKRIRRDLDASLAEAERQCALFEIAQTRLARGEVGRVLGWPRADEEAAQARRALREMGADFACSPVHALPPDEGDLQPITLSLADRFDQIVVQGCRIASALTPDDVHGALCDAAAVLLRGDASFVLAVDAGEPRVRVQRGGPAVFSSSLLERAMRERRPIASTDLLEEPLSSSVELPRPSFALCAPIVVRDRPPAACLYVTYAVAGDLRREDDERIVHHLATLAGASLEKAEAFASVQELSQTLLASNAELDANLRRLRDTQEQLVQAAKMAAVGTLLAGLSHELNNPLSVILGYAKLTARRMAASDPSRPAVVAIERQAQRCADLVRSFLDFARKRPLEVEDVPIADIVRQVGVLASPKVRGSGVELEMEVAASGTCAVRVSREKIESALLNLVVNAVDASPRGAVVRVDAMPSERAHRRGVEVCVRDHGAGMAPDVLSRVFEPFFTTKPDGAGTGLGLSLSRQFIEMHEGALWIESRVGEGTAARLWLPVADAAP
jgi:signal transduction histidine kinase/tetratricopeptide (TPR) repeat protein